MQFFRSKIKYFELNAQKYRIEGNFSDNTDRGNIIFVLVFFQLGENQTTSLTV